MMRKRFLITWLPIVGLLMASIAHGDTWTEIGDAGDGIPFGGQQTMGLGSLDSISGSLSNFDGTWDSTDDHVDAFDFKVTDATAFFASLVAADGGSFAGDNGFSDATLYIFDPSGDVVMGNDDKPGIFGYSYLSDPSTFPGGLTDSPGGLVNGNEYTLVVTYRGNDPVDINGNLVVEFSTLDKNLYGLSPNADTDFPNNWQNPGEFSNNDINYTIALSGATFSAVPEPGSVTLLAMGALALFSRRRRS